MGFRQKSKHPLWSNVGSVAPAWEQTSISPVTITGQITPRRDCVFWLIYQSKCWYFTFLKKDKMLNVNSISNNLLRIIFYAVGCTSRQPGEQHHSAWRSKLNHVLFIMKSLALEQAAGWELSITMTHTQRTAWMCGCARTHQKETYAHRDRWDSKVWKTHLNFGCHFLFISFLLSLSLLLPFFSVSLPDLLPSILQSCLSLSSSHSGFYFFNLIFFLKPLSMFGPLPVSTCVELITKFVSIIHLLPWVIHQCCIMS